MYVPGTVLVTFTYDVSFNPLHNLKKMVKILNWELCILV